MSLLVIALVTQWRTYDSQQTGFDARECHARCLHLRDNIDAVEIIFYHRRDTAHLPFHAPKTPSKRGLVICIAVVILAPPL